MIRLRKGALSNFSAPGVKKDILGCRWYRDYRTHRGIEQEGCTGRNGMKADIIVAGGSSERGNRGGGTTRTKVS